MSKKKKNKLKSKFDIFSTIQCILLFVFIATIIVAILKLINYYDAKQKAYILKNGKQTIGRIFETGSHKSTQHAYFEYYVNNIKHTVKSYPHYDGFYKLGEYFILIYDPNDPDEAIVDYTKPFFLKSQKIDSAQAYIENVINDNEDNIVTYSYLAGYKNQYRTQLLPKDKKYFLGDSCIVEYLIDHPRIARIILNSSQYEKVN